MPTCGGPPSATCGFCKAKLSATSPLWKLGMSPWCSASRVYAWASLRRTRWSQLLILQAVDWGSVDPRLRMGVPGPPLVTTTEPRLNLSVLLDLALDSDLARPPQAKVRVMFTSHAKLRGALRGHRPDRGASQCHPPGHHGRIGAFCRFLTVRSAWQEAVAQAHSLSQ